MDVVGPLDRGLAVLRAMSAPGGHRMRPSELARATGLARSTVDRVLATLIHLGHLREVDREVELAPPLMEPGNAYLTGCGVPDALGPVAERLADEFDESVSIAVPDGDGVRFVTQITRRRTMSLAFRIGDLLPAERCAPGALFAAGWDEADRAAWLDRRDSPERFPAVPARPATSAEVFDERVARAVADGWSADDQLIEPGLIAVAVPVRDPVGRTACAVSVVSHTSRHTVASLAEATLPRLRAETGAMEEALARALAEQAASSGTRGTRGARTAGTGGAAGAAGTARTAEEGVPVVGADPARTAKRELGPEFLQSLARGLTVLCALDGTRSLSAVADATGLARATARRALLTLEHLGYVERLGHDFRLLPRVLELGYAHLSSLGFAEIVQPHMADLVRRTRESASMAVLDGDDIRYVARVPTYTIMSVDITLGTRFPAYATSMGRVLLADLPHAERAALLAGTAARPITGRTVTDPAELTRIIDGVAERGHAFVDEELEEGLRALAVPVRDGTGRVVAALNVATHAARGPAEEALAALLPPLTDTAARIEADLRVVTRRKRLRLP
ncbi:helix-turn-helix domain-containing protein [Microtetraspora sp. AC03309]|uniref:IclR family transcriptional regulator domain-containing protein n=1 Tax=Microtetraspora sp. AC03309 TaxID=2779376 RepID=UPI0027E0D200|nr:IclR family transcriptional regulator C-terminal domain-containing protein [Microtetraspora sp. AC03309]MCC5581121.1 helix-turn-helix domain-containing protein [Microtetraspora sp. AC03309]